MLKPFSSEILRRLCCGYILSSDRYFWGGSPSASPHSWPKIKLVKKMFGGGLCTHPGDFQIFQQHPSHVRISIGTQRLCKSTVLVKDFLIVSKFPETVAWSKRTSYSKLNQIGKIQNQPEWVHNPPPPNISPPDRFLQSGPFDRNWCMVNMNWLCSTNNPYKLFHSALYKLCSCISTVYLEKLIF